MLLNFEQPLAIQLIQKNTCCIKRIFCELKIIKIGKNPILLNICGNNEGRVNIILGMEWYQLERSQLGYGTGCNLFGLSYKSFLFAQMMNADQKLVYCLTCVCFACVYIWVLCKVILQNVLILVLLCMLSTSQPLEEWVYKTRLYA